MILVVYAVIFRIRQAFITSSYLWRMGRNQTQKKKKARIVTSHYTPALGLKESWFQTPALRDSMGWARYGSGISYNMWLKRRGTLNKHDSGIQIISPRFSEKENQKIFCYIEKSKQTTFLGRMPLWKWILN